MLLVCSGMPRSGSTLQYNMAKSLVEGKGLGEAEGYFDSEQFPRLQTKFEEWENDSIIHVIKTHGIVPYSKELARVRLICIFIYIYRDIRDVAVSLRRKLNLEGEALFRSLDNAISVYYQLKRHDNVLFQRYEDVMRDHSNAVRELAEILRVTMKEEEIAVIVKKCSLENMRKLILQDSRDRFQVLKSGVLSMGRKLKARKILRVMGVPEDALSNIKDFLISYDKVTLMHHDHISSSSGASGVWRTALSKEELKVIMERYNHWLDEAGYQT